MEQSFQTSFIPKKPIVEEAKRSSPSASVGIFTLLSIFILFAVGLGSGGLYFYKKINEKRLTDLISNLEKAKSSFEASKISELQTLDKRLNAASEILASHTAISPIFKTLQDITTKSVRYSKFSYTDGGGKIDVKMTGQAVGYRAVAVQADLLGKNKYFIDPVFSNLDLDEKGNVTFDLNFSVSKTLVDYSQMLKTEKESVSNTTEQDININLTN